MEVPGNGADTVVSIEPSSQGLWGALANGESTKELVAVEENPPAQVKQTKVEPQASDKAPVGDAKIETTGVTANPKEDDLDVDFDEIFPPEEGKKDGDTATVLTEKSEGKKDAGWSKLSKQYADGTMPEEQKTVFKEMTQAVNEKFQETADLKKELQAERERFSAEMAELKRTFASQNQQRQPEQMPVSNRDELTETINAMAEEEGWSSKTTKVFGHLVNELESMKGSLNSVLSYRDEAGVKDLERNIVAAREKVGFPDDLAAIGNWSIWANQQIAKNGNMAPKSEEEILSSVKTALTNAASKLVDVKSLITNDMSLLHDIDLKNILRSHPKGKEVVSEIIKSYIAKRKVNPSVRPSGATKDSSAAPVETDALTRLTENILRTN